MAFDPHAIIPIIEKFQIVDFFLPTIIFFTIFYAVLKKSKMFEKDKTNTIISICLAAIISLGHLTNKIPRCYDAVAIMIDVLPKLAIFIFGMVIFLIILGLIGVVKEFREKWPGTILLATFLFFGYAFLSSRGADCPFFIEITEVGLIVFLIFAAFIGIVYLAAFRD